MVNAPEPLAAVGSRCEPVPGPLAQGIVPAARAARGPAAQARRAMRPWRPGSVGAPRIARYAAPHRAAWSPPAPAAQLQRFARAATAALDAGLGENAGHGPNRDNLAAVARAVPGLQEVSIGHALIADALELGYDATIKAYMDCLK